MARGRIHSSGMGATFWLISVAMPSHRAEGTAARAIQRRRSGRGGGGESGGSSAAVSGAERGALRKAEQTSRATTAA